MNTVVTILIVDTTVCASNMIVITAWELTWPMYSQQLLDIPKR